MAITLSTLRPLIKARLNAAAALSSYQVFLDDQPPGERQQDQEDALRAKGLIFSVPSVLGLTNLNVGAAQLTTMNAELVVHLRCIPSIRAKLLDTTPLETLVEAAVLAITGPAPERGSSQGTLQPAADLVRLVPEDIGCITYALNFSARYTLTT